MPKSNHSKSSTTKALEKATKDWRSAKKRERAARNALAAIVNEAVASGVMSENKVASVTEIPRMTIRKMLGKDEPAAEALATEPAPATAPIIEAVPAPVIEAVPAPVIEAVPAPVIEVVPAPVIEAHAVAADLIEPESAPVDTEADAGASQASASEAESPTPAVASRPVPAWGTPFTS